MKVFIFVQFVYLYLRRSKRTYGVGIMVYIGTWQLEITHSISHLSFREKQREGMFCLVCLTGKRQRGAKIFRSGGLILSGFCIKLIKQLPRKRSFFCEIRRLASVSSPISLANAAYASPSPDCMASGALFARFMMMEIVKRRRMKAEKVR